MSRDVSSSWHLARVGDTLSGMKRIVVAVILLSVSFVVAAQSSRYGTISASTPTSPLRVGDTVVGELSASDTETDDGSYLDWYSMRVEEGQSYRIELESEAFDTFLVVRLPGGAELTNDDASFTDSALVVSPSSSGELFLGATSFGFSTTGPYVVRVMSYEAQTIAAGAQIAGVLDEPTVVYELSADAGDLLEVVLRSSEFDTYLEIEDADGNYFYNDDAESTSVSRILYTMARGGSARITVSAWDDSADPDRSFTLEVIETEYDSEEYPPGYELSDGEVIETLLVMSPGGQSDYVEKLYTLQADAGERIELTLRSDAFDSYLTVYGPAGQTFEDDDSAGNLDSRLVFVAPEGGVYEVVVASLGGSDTGPYTLEFERMGQAETILQQQGTLSEDDQRDIRGKYYDLLSFSVDAGDQIIIEVRSEEFDGYALLQNADGDILVENDDASGSSNPRIEYLAAGGGELTLVVTSFSRDETGTYDVLIYR